MCFGKKKKKSIKHYRIHYDQFNFISGGQIVISTIGQFKNENRSLKKVALSVRTTFNEIEVTSLNFIPLL